MKLGRIQKIDLREIWKHEASDFSKWLSSPENISYLNEIINLELVDIETEKSVGGFKCDLYCKDEITNKIVIIENQLESTDHDHLGKIITYASGLDASVIIWIAKSVREEHASAIEWLNNNTNENVSFFLLKIELIKIDDSLPAPKFEVIEAPNNYNKNVKNSINRTNSEIETSRYEFWVSFNEVMEVRKEFNKRTPSTDHWYDISIGSSQCHLSIDLLSRERKIRINMWIIDNKELYDFFFENKASIENAIGFSIDWMRKDDKKASRICTYIDEFSFSNSDLYFDYSNKIIDYLVIFRNAFKPYLDNFGK